jgi:hypothetical protein
MGGIGQASLGRGIDPQFPSTPTGSVVFVLLTTGFGLSASTRGYSYPKPSGLFMKFIFTAAHKKSPGDVRGLVCFSTAGKMPALQLQAKA